MRELQLNGSMDRTLSIISVRQTFRRIEGDIDGNLDEESIGPVLEMGGYLLIGRDIGEGDIDSTWGAQLSIDQGGYISDII